MARPYSMDLRERLVAAVEGVESRRSAARRFGVSASVAVTRSAAERYQRTVCCAARRRLARGNKPNEPWQSLAILSPPPNRQTKG